MLLGIEQQPHEKPYLESFTLYSFHRLSEVYLDQSSSTIIVLSLYNLETGSIYSHVEKMVKGSAHAKVKKCGPQQF